jgi:pimeloyl-ACP methyl ester carboxylesterase
MQGYRKRFTRLGPERVAHYDEGPRANQAVVFLHGLPTSSFLWRKVIKGLSDRYRCIAPDLLGLGDSSAPLEADHSLPGQARRIADLIEALKLEKVVLVGHDYGGAVAQMVALRHGRAVQALALCDSACYDNWPVGVIRTVRHVCRNGAAFEIFVRSGMAKQLAYSRSGFKAGVRHPGSLGPREIEEYLRPLLLSETLREHFRRLMLDLGNEETREISNEFYRFPKPVLVVWALDDVFFPLIWGERLATDFPKTELRTISDCGHFVPEERPRQLTGHLEQFLKFVFTVLGE